MEPKEIRDLIQQGKSKDDLSKNWAQMLEEIKKKKTPPAITPSQPFFSKAKEPEPAGDLGELPGDKIRRLETELAAQREKSQALLVEIEALKTKQKELESKSPEEKGGNDARDGQLKALEEEIAAKTTLLAEADNQLMKLRVEFASRAGDVERLIHEKEEAGEKIAGMQAQLAAFASLESQNAGLQSQVKDLTAQLQEKDKQIAEWQVAVPRQAEELMSKKNLEIERLRYQLERFEKGEIQQSWQNRIEEAQTRVKELQATLGAKEKELESFRDFLSRREAELSKKGEDWAKDFAVKSQELSGIIDTLKQKVEERDGEIVSLRRLLRNEEERSRVLEARASSLDTHRLKLEERLSQLTDELKSHVSHLGQSLDKAQAPSSPGKPASAPEAPLQLPHLAPSSGLPLDLGGGAWDWQDVPADINDPDLFSLDLLEEEEHG